MKRAIFKQTAASNSLQPRHKKRRHQMRRKTRKLIGRVASVALMIDPFFCVWVFIPSQTFYSRRTSFLWQAPLCRRRRRCPFFLPLGRYIHFILVHATLSINLTSIWELFREFCPFFLNSFSLSCSLSLSFSFISLAMFYAHVLFL